MGLPLPVPYLEKKLISAVVKGLLSSIGMQYLAIEENKLLYSHNLITYHIACTWSDSSLLFARSAIKDFTFSNSATPPASNPRESWKMNPGLLLNTISFLISCSPRWSSFRSMSPTDWDNVPLPKAGAPIAWSAGGPPSVSIKIFPYAAHLLSLAIIYNWFLRGVTDFLQNSCLSGVGSAYDEDAEATTLHSV